MNKQILVCGALFAALSAFAVAHPHVDQESVTIVQDGGRVMIGYTLDDAPAVVTVDIQTKETSASDWTSIGPEHYTSLQGDVNQVVQPGDRMVVWRKPYVDWPGHRLTNALRAVVTAWPLDKTPDYMVVDLANRSRRFYASAAAVPGGVTDDAYKTEKILMRRVAARGETWRMGSSFGDATRASGDNELPHYVTLSADYYLGVYEVTEAQWCGGSWQGTVRTDKLPARNMSYDDIRGTDKVWPGDKHAVGGALLTLRTLTGVPFDLPTEAQWEYACRAGMGTEVSIPIGVSYTINDLAWTKDNGGVVHDVGERRPNAWGFYDMYGNVAEWCLDWFSASYYGDICASEDPKGPDTGAKRVKRGGCFALAASYARNASRDSDRSAYAANNHGLRLCCGADVSQYGVDDEAAFSSPRNLTFSYKLTGTNAIVTVDIQTNVAGTAEWASIGAAHAKTFAGEVNKVVTQLNVLHEVTWFPDLDWPDHEVSANSVRAVFTFWDLSAPPDYMSVDLGAKGNCRRFYTCEAAVPGILSDASHPCRHSRLLMRRIPAAGVTFRMGSPSVETDRNANELARLVSFSEDFYLGVFELTTGQYSNGNWSRFENDSPKSGLSYDDVRGTATAWPNDHHAVADSSPLASLRARVGVSDIDLPTEAQWEFACRAGSTEVFGIPEGASLSDYAWYKDSVASVHDVGKLKPNAWGLYDMHGNLLEWVLDWQANYDTEDVVNPKGPDSGTKRVKRGGYYASPAKNCRSAYRDSDASSFQHVSCGVRLCCGANVNLFDK